MIRPNRVLKLPLYFVLGWLFPLTDGICQTWNEANKIVGSDRMAIDWNGYHVSINGTYAVTGSWKQDADELGNNLMNEAGAAYLIESDGANWSEVQKIVPSDRTAMDAFGFSVAINGSTALIGANRERDGGSGDPSLTNAGSAYFYERDSGGNWLEGQKIAPSDRNTGDYFGTALGLTEDYALVSSYHNDWDVSGGAELSEAGAAFFFKRNISGVWEETQKVVASDRAAFDEYGGAVAIRGNRAIIGARWKETDASGSNPLVGAGGAYIYERDGGGVWNEAGILIAPDREQFDNLGWSVSIEGDYAVAGAYREEDDENGNNNLLYAGSAYIFKRNSGGVWEFVQKIVPSDRDAGDQFGISVALSGSYLLVGAHKDDINNIEQMAGAAYIFKLNSSGVWEEHQKIVSSDRAEEDSFAYSVAMDGQYLICGAYLEDEDAAGGNTIDEAGSVYIFDSGPLSVQDELVDEQITIFPNPSTDEVILRLEVPFEDLEVRLFSLQGQILKTMQFANNTEISISTSDLSSGTYLIQLKSEKGSVTTKLIKE